MTDSTNFKTVRTMEEVSQMLSILFYNMNRQNQIYYDLFINPEPMDIELERYDETGKLITVIVPNRAKDKSSIYTSGTNPNGLIAAPTGSFCFATGEGYMYYKAIGSDAFNWVLLWSDSNLVAGTDFLAPDGNGSNLTALNAANISSGTLSVTRGGTGAEVLTGLVKGNGTLPFTSAVDGVDYLGPNAFTGVIAYYPVATIPTGWLKCDGSAVSRSTYANLFGIIGTTYGAGDGTSTFNIPDLRDEFVRCWDGSRAFNSEQAAQVGGHTHPLSGNTGAGTAHSHTRGTMNITGNLYAGGGVSFGADGAMAITANHDDAHAQNWYGNAGGTANFDASRTWTGSTSAESSHTHPLSGNTGNNSANAENRVKNKALVAMIKY